MLPASLWGCSCSAALFPDGMEATAWAVGTLVNSESPRDPGPWCHSWQEGHTGTLLDNRNGSCAPCV